MFGSQFHRAVCCVVFLFNIISFPCLYILIRQAPSRRQAGHRLRISSAYAVALRYDKPSPIVPLREDTSLLVLSYEPPPPLVASLPVSSKPALVDPTESEHMLSAVPVSLRFLPYFPSIVAYT
jgi:hypothetical protein